MNKQLFGDNYPLVMEFLNNIFNDRDITKYFIKSIAYGLLMKKSHKVLVFYTNYENTGLEILLRLLNDLSINNDSNYKLWSSFDYNLEDKYNCLSLIINKDKLYNGFNWIVKSKNMLPYIGIKIKSLISIFLLSNTIDEPSNYSDILNQLNDLIKDEIELIKNGDTYIEVPEAIQNNIYLIDAI